MALVELGLILHFEKGKKPISQSDSPADGFLPYVDIEAFETGKIKQYTDGTKCTPCDDGDILIVCDGSRSGLVGRAVKGYVGSTLAKISADCLSDQYLFHFVQGKYALLNTKKKGTGTPHLNQELLKQQKLIVPSYSEQERIVARIEELFSQLDAGLETLKKTKAQLAVYRQAVLKEAFDSIEDQYYQTLNTAILGSPQNGLYKPKSDYSDNGTPILRIDGFYDGFIVKDYYYKRVNLSVDEITRYSLEIGDLIVNRVNSMPYLGKCALVRFLGETTVFESNMMRIKLDNEKVNGDFLTYYLSSSTGRKELTKSAKQAVNQASINQTDVGNAIVPMPPVEIQKRLLTYIESRLSVCDSIEQTVDAALQQAEAMRQSILKQAFKGKL